MLEFSFDRRFSAIAVTGGPCAGKSTFLAIARQRLEDLGMRVAVQSEVATELINAGFLPIEGWSDPLEFQRFLLVYTLHREEMYYQMLKGQDVQMPLVLLCDRGALDAIAYIGKKRFSIVLERARLNLHDLRERYKAVVHMVTAADGAEDYYTLENNPARSEGLLAARDLDERTCKAWVGHQNLFVVNNSTDFKGKVTRALEALTRVLDMPKPKEKERKFVVRNWDPRIIPLDAVSVDIQQDYLLPGPNGEERRVRARILDDSPSYYYTEKSDTDEVGVRNETERQIRLTEYDRFLGDRDPKTVTIMKTRHNISFGSHVFQVDEYHRPVDDLVVVEVEVRDMKEHVDFPPYLELEEVTGNEKYSNRCIAEGSLS